MLSVQKRRYLIVSHQTCDHESGPKVGHILVRGLSNKHEFQKNQESPQESTVQYLKDLAAKSEL